MCPVRVDFEKPVVVTGKTGNNEWRRTTNSLVLRLDRPIRVITEGIETEIVHRKGCNPEEPPKYRTYDCVDVSFNLTAPQLPEIHKNKKERALGRYMDPDVVVKRQLGSDSLNPYVDGAGGILADRTEFKVKWVESKRGKGKR